MSAYREVGFTFMRRFPSVLWRAVLGWFVLMVLAGVFHLDNKFPVGAISLGAVLLVALAAWNSLSEDLAKFKKAAAPNGRTFATKRRQLLRLNEYNVVEDYGWEDEKKRYLAMHKITPASWIYRDAMQEIERLSLVTPLPDSIQPAPKFEASDGPGYERACRQMLVARGWSVIETAASGDKGVDLLAIKDGLKVAIQCKNYASSVGSHAVQEIYAGAEYEKADYAVVVSPSAYTRQAIDMASTLGVRLIHTDDLQTLFERLA